MPGIESLGSNSVNIERAISLSEVRDFIKRVLSRTRISREKFVENKVPSSFSPIKLVLFFGDIRSEFVLSTLLMHRLYDIGRSDYLIVLGWPGHSGLFPYADEYWCVEDENVLSDLNRHVSGFDNDKLAGYEKSLLRYFDHVTPAAGVVASYYSDGFSKEFIERFKEIHYQLPSVPSIAIRWGQELSQDTGPRIVLNPSKFVQTWQQGRSLHRLVQEEFWETLVSQLLKRHYRPVLLTDYASYDLSPHFNDACAYITDQNLLTRLGAMRASDCVLDMFNGLSRYALVARCPYFICDERMRYFNSRDYELDDLCGSALPKDFFFSFTPLLDGGHDQIVHGVMNKLDQFIPTIDKDRLPSSVEKDVRLPYELIRKRNPLRLGLRFLKPPQLD